MRRLLLAHSGTGPPPAGPVDPIDPPSPTATFNADTFLVMTDPYGHSGSVIHLDVIDFGASPWRGHRYWMACTPFYARNDQEENPCVYYADDPTQWIEAGTNPKYGPPPADPYSYFSDTELLHDPVSDELVLMFRGNLTDPLTGGGSPLFARSSDGINYPAQPTHTFTWPGPGGEILSPSFVHDGTRWLAWAINGGNPADRRMYRWTAPALEGPWSEPIECTGWAEPDIWHMNVIKQGDRYLAIVNVGMLGVTAYAGSSDDGGLTWTKRPNPILVPRPGEWDYGQIYRVGMALKPDGVTVGVWYPAEGADSWRVGYVEIPVAIWPT